MTLSDSTIWLISIVPASLSGVPKFAGLCFRLSSKPGVGKYRQ